MLNRVDELEAFKTRINLSEYAASCGYVMDRKASSRSSVVMTHPNSDKLIVAVDHDGHWIYFSVRDDADNGSIIDFVQRRRGFSLGEARKELRPFLDAHHSPALPRPHDFVSALTPASKDLLRVRARFEAMLVSDCHPYLFTERKIPGDVLRDPRFSGRVRIDSHGNAVFPHGNFHGLSGFEVKNREFTGFAPGGEKGLWASHIDAEDTALVIAETAIDALSHFALKRPGATRYVSTAGSLNKTQPELIQRAARKLPQGGLVVVATDNDPGGDALLKAICEALSGVDRIKVVENRPLTRGDDWNDVLKKSLIR